jgi:hypothetical protein
MYLILQGLIFYLQDLTGLLYKLLGGQFMPHCFCFVFLVNKRIFEDEMKKYFVKLIS